MLAEDATGGNPMYMTIFSLDSDRGEYHDACMNLGDREIMVWKYLFDVDSDLAKKLLSEHKPWCLWEARVDDVWTANLKKWVSFMKEYAPEFLADLF